MNNCLKLYQQIVNMVAKHGINILKNVDENRATLFTLGWALPNYMQT